MATPGHALHQQAAGPVIQRLKTLTNEELKRICKAHNYQVSGTKQVLITRCVEAVTKAIQHGSVKDFEDLKYRSENRARSPPPGIIDAAMRQPPPPGPRIAAPPRNGPYFKSSPFYEILQTLVPLQELPAASEMPNNRHHIRTNLTLQPDVSEQCRRDPSIKIMMYCGQAAGMVGHNLVDVAFPGQIEVKVGDQEVKSNYRGLKNKPGSTKPADLTAYVRKFQGQQNNIQLTYALTTRRYAFVIHLVRYNNAETLVQRIKSRNIIRKQSVLKDMQQANSDPDIAATSVTMSLKDPISTMRITLPIRSSHCKHNQCFDANFFMMLQEQAPQWSCPVCSKTIPFDSLCVDEYFQELLKATSDSAEKIDIEPNGAWNVVKEEEEDEGGVTVPKPRATYDDDFDDEDLVELDPATLSKPSKSASASNLNRPTALDTPPLSSREPSVAQSASSVRGNKRPQSAVIDLTLSEDEQPPRSAKRQQANRQPSAGGSSNSYNTPNSNPDPLRMQLPQRQGSHNPLTAPQADSFRTNSNNRLSLNQSSLFGASRSQSSMSPATNSPNLAFGQPSPLRQQNRPNAINLPGLGSNYNPSTYNNDSVFPPNSPFNNIDSSGFASPRPPSLQPQHQQPYHRPQNTLQSPTQPQFYQQQPNRMQSPTQQQSYNGSGLALPPMQPQQQQAPQSYSPFASPHAPNGSSLWRGNDAGYGWNFNNGGPSG